MKPSVASIEAVLARIRIVLVSTSHPGNIGAAARALKTMGLQQLVLVAPRFEDALTHPDALAFATGAADVLQRARICARLEEAISDCSWAVALTARHRDISLPEIDPQAAARQAVALIGRDGVLGARSEIAFVFGSERYGLSNEDLMKCQSACTVPTSENYSSLNLAQAVQIVSYECRLAMIAAAYAEPAEADAGAGAAGKPNSALATVEEREQFFAHLQEALIAIEFLNAEYPKKLMQRLRRLYSRTELEHEEVNILRGICTAILSLQEKNTRNASTPVSGIE